MNQSYLVRYVHHVILYSASDEALNFLDSLEVVFENYYFELYKITDSQLLEYRLKNYSFANISSDRKYILETCPLSVQHIIEERL